MIETSLLFKMEHFELSLVITFHLAQSLVPEQEASAVALHHWREELENLIT